MRRLPFLLLLLSAGCYERRMGAWVGHSYGELISAWGTPTTRHARPGGGTVLAWANQESGPDGYETCRRSFATDRAGTVINWAVDHCDWRTTRIPQPPRPR